MRKLRKIAIVFLSLALLVALSAASLAHEVPDGNRDGSIRLLLTCEGKSITGGTFKIWLVGEIKEDDGNYSFEKAEGISGYTGSLDELGSAALVGDLSNYVDSNGVASVASAGNSDGTVVFRKLKPGLYLVRQTKASQGYQSISPFFVSVPQCEDGVYIYNVNATPKIGTIVPTVPTSPTVPTGSKLPQTGMLWWPVAVLACIGLAFLIFGAMFGGKKRHE